MQNSIVLDAAPASQVRMPSAARNMLRAFEQQGVRAAFGIPGGLISPLFDALADVPNVRLVSTRHEAMAGFAAMGHAVATGKPALVLTTSGPGITNALTAIAAADAEELPLVVIGGEVATSATSRGAFQDASTNAIDAVAMMRTMTRWSARVESPAAAAAMAARAFRAATGPKPGPVFLSVPLDVGNGLAAGAPPTFVAAAPPPAAPDLGVSAKVALALARASRPLLVVGNGARSAAHEVRELAEATGCPVVCTAHGKGIFPDSHPLHLGIIGFGAHPSAREYVESGPDVVLIVGSRLGDFATDGWALPLGGTAATFQIDRDGTLLGRNYPLTLAIVADAAAALRGILAALPATAARKRRSPPKRREVRPESAASDAAPLKPARVLGALQEAFPDAFWTSDIGEHCAHVVHRVRIESPDRFRAMLGFASMGSGIGTAIGVRHARPDLPVVCVCGDGGFAMHAGDMLTCVENGIDVVFVVLNDGRWNMVHHGFQAVYGREPPSLPRSVANLALVASGFGALGVRIESAQDLDASRLRALAALGRPLVLDVRVDGDDALSAETRSAAVRRSAFGGAA
jgi:acetolactate synthase-1/2/3 large subunit